eukprot:7944582-Karenia_brevis.AAC.1
MVLKKFGITTGNKVFQAKYHIGDLLNYIEHHPKSGKFWAIDGFGGVGNVQQVWQNNGLAAAKFELEDGPGNTQNAIHQVGFFHFLDLILAAHVGQAALIGAPPCKLWIFLSSSIHCRKSWNAYCGNTKLDMIFEANALAENWAILLAIGNLRGLFCLNEHPGST